MENKNKFQQVIMIIFPMFIYWVIQVAFINISYFFMIFMATVMGKENPATYGYNVAMGNILLLNAIAMIIAIPIFASMYKKERNLKSYYEKNYPWKLIGKFVWIIPFGLFGMLAANYFVSFLTLFMPRYMIESYSGSKDALVNASIFLQIVATSILAPMVEELIFRGIVYNRLKKIMPMAAAVIVSSALFGAYHMNWLQAPYGFLIGLLAIFIYERYQTIFASIFFHGMANMFSVMVLFFAKSQTGDTAQLSNSEMMINLLMLIVITSMFELLIGSIIKKRVVVKEINENEIINDYNSVL